MSHLYLLGSIAGEAIALPADRVSSVVEVDEVTPVPLADDHIAGLFALRSRVLTVVDTLAALGLGRTPMSSAMQGVIVTADGHGYVLLVERVDDVIELGEAEPIGVILGHGWSDAAIGLLDHDGRPILLLDPDRLIGGRNAASVKPAPDVNPAVTAMPYH